jgi:hypothetical protein
VGAKKKAKAASKKSLKGSKKLGDTKLIMKPPSNV